jgi:dolichol-phosphate mannosyltransferase
MESAELAIIVPTFNERQNVGLLVAQLESALTGVNWEAIFVDDDSPDGTAAALRALAATNARVRCVHRIGRRGLSRAVVEGALATSAPFIGVIDADLQHDSTKLTVMLAMLKGQPLDIIVGTRYDAGGSIGNWDSKRGRMSAFATRLSRWVISAPLSDPMSGFFMMRRDAFMQSVRHLSGEGYKILLDLFASAPKPLRFAEIPYHFALRQHGESKLDTAVMWEYVLLLLDKKIGHVIPPRFLLFSAVGLLGVFVHLAVLQGVLHGLKFPFAVAQSIATITAMTGNFVINNVLTYHDRRLRGANWLKGLLSFYAVCGMGAVANVGVAQIVFDRPTTWWLAGLAGAVVGSVWNYMSTSIFTWGKRK